MLTWPKDIGEEFVYHVDNEPIPGLRDEVSFVAIKNGGHNGIGYLLDTGAKSSAEPRIALKEMPRLIAAACGATWAGA